MNRNVKMSAEAAKMMMQAPEWWSRSEKAWWSAMSSQMRDKADNDNRTDAERVRDAQEMVRWARDRMDQPAWSATASAMMVEAQSVVRSQRPRAV